MNRRVITILAVAALVGCDTSVRRSGGGGSRGTRTSTTADAGIRDVMGLFDTGTSGGRYDGGTNASVDPAPRSAFSDELDSEQLRSVCLWIIDRQGGSGQTVCEGNLTVNVPTLDECLTGPRPHCAMSLIYDCMRALDGDPCKIFSASECSSYLSCVFGE